MSGIELATWNTEWISRSSEAFDRATKRIRQLDSDILALTEVTTDLIPDGGQVVLGGDDWGYPSKGERRKVALWSRWPVTDHASDLLDPPGRHIAATLASPLGAIRVHAVCIPWRDAHVRTGRKDSQPWEEHLRFLSSLSELLADESQTDPTSRLPRIVLGDMNLRGGAHPYGSEETRQAWEQLLARECLATCTPDEVIDKIALGEGLVAESARTLPPNGISDHHAVAATVNLT